LELLAFLVKVFWITLSGALQPGAVTAAAISMGTRNRFAGLLMALGHGIIEFPLMILLIVGLGELVQRPSVGIAIGLAGGTFLVLMGSQLMRDLKKSADGEVFHGRGGPLMTGIVLTGANPYFLIWWATVGLTLVTTAKGLGVWAFVLFALVHWSVDLVWLTFLSYGSFKGTSILSPKRRKYILLFCAVTLLGFGVYFIGDKAITLIRLLRG